jgi:aminoglycoside N3'-acetyltransferase
MKINDKIYKLGLMVLDELLLHSNVSKETKITIEDATILSDMIVHVGPHGIFTLSEKEIDEFYREWARRQ